MHYYEKMTEIRKRCKMSQAEVANHLKTTQQQIHKYEKGLQEMPVSRFIELAELYHVSLDELAGLKNLDT